MAFCSPCIPTPYKGIGNNATRSFAGTATNSSVILNRVNRETLGDRLGRVLQERSLSQSELARQVGVRPQAIQYICDKKAKRSSFVAEIAEALNISPFWLATGKGLREPWGALDAGARLVATKYHELPPHGQRQLQEYLDYLRKRFPPEADPHLVIC